MGRVLRSWRYAAMPCCCQVRLSVTYQFERCAQAFTQHNPRVCLTDDDLEALNVLYPDCLGGFTVPLCAKSPLNLGWIRILLSFCVPFSVCLLSVLIIHNFATRKLEKINASRTGIRTSSRWLPTTSIMVCTLT